jgi:ATP-binding cassette subfamily F protein uup
LSAAQRRELQKEQQKTERSIAKHDERIRELLAEMEQNSSDFEKVARLNDELQPLMREKESLEFHWLEVGALLD